ncbi:MAG: 16S rRNA processing protein RimM [Ruminococcaceae bacterium]|nr:16S rRNA processing protein RimM [Oscillospiraceae bacterium]
MKQPYLECGKIINTHGVRGGIKVESYCDTPHVLASLPQLFLKKSGIYEAHKVVKASVGNGRVLLYLAGIDTLDAAILLKGKVLYAKREDLPLEEGAHFIADLIGLPLLDADTGREYGKIISVDDMPSSEMYTVRTPDGKELLFPAIAEFVVKVDVDAGVYIRPIPGFFEEDEDA